MIDNGKMPRLSISLLSFNLFAVRLLNALSPTQWNVRWIHEYNEHKE